MPDYKFFFADNKQAQINAQVQLTDEQKYWREHTYRRFAFMRAARQMNGQENKWNNFQRQYDAERPPKGSDDWQSTIVPPFTTSVVEAALSEMVDQTLQPVVAARTKADVPKATTINFVKDYTWEIGMGDIELYKSLKQFLITGTTIWSEYYWQDKRKVKFVQYYDKEKKKEVEKEVEIYEYDDCYGETVNLMDVWFDENARYVNYGPYKAQDAIRRYVMHIDTFRQTFIGSRFDMFGLAQYVKPSGDTNYFQYYKPFAGIDQSSQVEVLWHWMRNPDKLIIVANDIPFCITPNPFHHKQLPFAVGHDLLNPWSIYGKGEPELLESIQDELTTIRRMRLDRQKLDIYKMIFVSNRETLTDQDLIPAPMKPLFVDDIANVKAFEYGDVNPSAFKEEQLLKEDGIRVTGIDDRFQGIQPKGATATEAAILKESTLKRLRTKIWLTSRTLLMEQVRLRAANIMQFYRTPKIKQIVGDDSYDLMRKIREVSEENRLLELGGKYYEAEFRTIRTKNKQLKVDDNGELKVEDKRGDNFFMVRPELLAPTAVSFDFKMSAEPTFPLSKPLLQQKTNEMMSSPLFQLAISSGYYDFKKAVDKQVEVNDFDPDDFKAQDEGAEKQGQLIDPQKMLDMANRENEMMMGGEDLVGTPFATLDHTEIHVAFMQSPPFKENASPELVRRFSRHILEEAIAQQQRIKQQGPVKQGMTPGVSGGRTAETSGIESGVAKATQPAKMMGSEAAPDLAGAA